MDIVRRRSGGGTVFHDRGNVNYCVISPPATFTRDKHAHMVARALHSLSVPSAVVNSRHDIVMTCPLSNEVYKVSGSAYKLTRTRALHHGTCLLSSPNLSAIPGMLDSPLRGCIPRAQGVESVRSAVRNVGVCRGEFEGAVVGEFTGLYGGVGAVYIGEEGGDGEAAGWDVRQGEEELRSLEWIWGQTPRFAFSSAGRQVSFLCWVSIAC